MICAYACIGGIPMDTWHIYAYPIWVLMPGVWGIADIEKNHGILP
jgi:hypothetical protein